MKNKKSNMLVLIGLIIVVIVNALDKTIGLNDVLSIILDGIALVCFISSFVMSFTDKK